MILWTVILWRLEAGLGWADRETATGGSSSKWILSRVAAWVSLSPAWVSLEARFALRDSLSLVSLSVSLVSPSRRHGDTAASLSLSVSLRLVLSLVALASRSLTFLSSFFFLFFPLVFAFSVWFWTIEGWDFFFSFFFFLVVDWHGLWPYGLCSELAGWWARGRGARAKISGRPKPLFFFLEKFYLLKNFFFGPRGASGPLSLVPGSVPECVWWV